MLFSTQALFPPQISTRGVFGNLVTDLCFFFAPKKPREGRSTVHSTCGEVGMLPCVLVAARLPSRPQAAPYLCSHGLVHRSMFYQAASVPPALQTPNGNVALGGWRTSTALCSSGKAKHRAGNLLSWDKCATEKEKKKKA